MDNTIKAVNVSKKFDDNIILDNINFEWESGKIYGLIGRNGSGKTLLMRMLCGLVLASSGNIYVNGIEVGKHGTIPHCIGAVIETPVFLSKFSGYRNLRFLADLRGDIHKNDIHHAMRLVGLDPNMTRPVEKYSLGMRQRLGIAQAIMEDPPILMLDEPMNGLDSDGVDRIHHIINQYKNSGRLVILASHMLDDVMKTCDEVYSVQNKNLIRIMEDRHIVDITNKTE